VLSLGLGAGRFGVGTCVRLLSACVGLVRACALLFGVRTRLVQLSAGI
jgi:hypothetical protein